MSITVHFQPEAWINDYAVAVDDEGPDAWVVTDDTASMIATMDEAHDDLDFVRGDENAPEWVREWQGPFEITIVDEA